MSPQTLPEGVTIAPAELSKITDALDALAKGTHIPRQLAIVVTLPIYQEYPKHLRFGSGKEIETVVVNSVAEELAEVDRRLGGADMPAAPAPEAPTLLGDPLGPVLVPAPADPPTEAPPAIDAPQS
jgi:hypothetical protein